MPILPIASAKCGFKIEADVGNDGAISAIKVTAGTRPVTYSVLISGQEIQGEALDPSGTAEVKGAEISALPSMTIEPSIEPEKEIADDTPLPTALAIRFEVG